VCLCGQARAFYSLPVVIALGQICTHCQVPWLGDISSGTVLLALISAEGSAHSAADTTGTQATDIVLEMEPISPTMEDNKSSQSE